MSYNTVNQTKADDKEVPYQERMMDTETVSEIAKMYPEFFGGS